MSREPALLTSAGRMPERSQHRVSEGQDARSERPATGHGQPRTVASEAFSGSPPEGGGKDREVLQLPPSGVSPKVARSRKPSFE